MIYTIINGRVVPEKLVRRCVILLLLLHVFEGMALPKSSETSPQILSDTLQTDCLEQRNHIFKPCQLMLPAALVAAGSVAAVQNPLHKASVEVSRNIYCWRNSESIMLEDYTQYAPVVAAVTLDLAGVKARHPFRDRLCITATAYAVMGATTNALKWIVDEKRPDSGALNSFPSGHTATAFMGAELVRLEYGGWCGFSAYVMATSVGIMRVYHGRHWLHDVVAGAGIGILSARIGEWSVPVWQRVFKSKSHVVTVCPTVNPGASYGISFTASW